MFNGSTHKGESRRSCGGVGRNLAAALVNLGMTNTKFLSVIGDDEAGRAIVDSLGDAAASKLRTLRDIGTARYTAVVDNKGDCCFGIGEMEAFMKIDEKYLQQNISFLKNIPILVLDGNPPLGTLKLALDIAAQNKTPVWYEPTDLNKVLKIFECGTQWQKVLYFVSPNINELMAIAKHFEIPVPKSEINLEIIKKVAEHLNKWIPVIITTLGAQGVLVTRKSSKHEPFLDACKHLVETSGVQSHLYTPLRYDREILSVSGCGDCLAAGIITGILRGWKESSSILLGLHAARESLSSFETVPNTLKSLSNMQDFLHFYV